MSDAKNPAGSVAAVVDSSTAGTVTASVGAAATTTTSDVSTPTIRFPLASGGCNIVSTSGRTSTTAASYSFRGHAQVASYLRQYSRVELVEVRATVYQTAVVAAPTEAESVTPYTPYVIRFGLAPRGLSGSDSGTNIIHTIPNLRNFVTSTQVATNSTVTYSITPSGDQLPFPPGVQTNFRDVEITHNYVEFFVGLTNPDSKSRYVCCVQLDFLVECSGVNFNAPA
jgi:hypothetical protein